jgi:hypothetical protein
VLLELIAMEEDKEADDGDYDLPPLVHRTGYIIGDNFVREVCGPFMPCDLSAIANNEDSADEGKKMDQEDDILPSFINLNHNFDDEVTDNTQATETDAGTASAAVDTQGTDTDAISSDEEPQLKNQAVKVAKTVMTVTAIMLLTRL